MMEINQLAIKRLQHYREQEQQQDLIRTLDYNRICIRCAKNTTEIRKGIILTTSRFKCRNCGYISKEYTNY